MKAQKIVDDLARLHLHHAIVQIGIVKLIYEQQTDYCREQTFAVARLNQCMTSLTELSTKIERGEK
jgi:hypothetical protein